MKKYLVLIVLFSCFAQITFSDAAALNRKIALLDFTTRTGGSPGATQSVKHALDVAGIPYIVTTNVATASTHAMIVIASRVKNGTLTNSEITAIRNYVVNGGILVASRVASTKAGLLTLFGISGSTALSTRHAMTWNTAGNDPSLRWFNDPNEKTISLGRASIPIVIPTLSYTLNGATSLASFDDGSTAMTKNIFGVGTAYAIGLPWKEFILRNQMNRDFKAQRTSSNGFEPTTDTIFLFLRAIYESNVSYAAWKHTSPFASAATLMITHDVSGQVAQNMMNDFAAIAASHKTIDTFNINTHYNVDGNGGDSYTMHFPQMAKLISQNQKLGNHSVGHFQDFGTLPVGAPGNTMQNYTPMYNSVSKTTTGGTVYGEIEVPGLLLSKDIGETIRVFRSGFLAWAPKQPNVLAALKYSYDSSRSANNVLTNFPYLLRNDTLFSGTTSSVYEIPMTISDRKMTALNASQWVQTWINVLTKNKANFAPTVLLLHPNRTWKAQAQKNLLSQLPAGISIYDMEFFGDYWRARNSFTYDTAISGTTLTITIPDTAFPLNKMLSIFVKDGRTLTTIITKRQNGTPVAFSQANSGTNDLLLYQIQTAPTASNMTSTVNYTTADTTVALNNIVTSDPDSNSLTATLVLADSTSGTLSISGKAKFTPTSGIWKITGTVAEVNAALANVAFLPAAGYIQNTSISTSVTDGMAFPLTGMITVKFAGGVPAPVNAGGVPAPANAGGGKGGCVLNPYASVDPVLPILLLMAVSSLMLRRRRSI